jgi:hypothetical protein
MIHDFADNFAQALLYLCFLVLMILVTGRCLFLVMQWFFRWMVS